ADNLDCSVHNKGSTYIFADGHARWMRVAQTLDPVNMWADEAFAPSARQTIYDNHWSLLRTGARKDPRLRDCLEQERALVVPCSRRGSQRYSGFLTTEARRARRSTRKKALEASQPLSRVPPCTPPCLPCFRGERRLVLGGPERAASERNASMNSFTFS